MPEPGQDIRVSNKLPWIAAMAIFMQSLDSTILNTALPAIAADLGHSPLSMQSVIVSYALTLALFIPLGGWLADKYGTRKVFSIAMGIFTLGSLLCAVSTGLPALVISRIIQAIGGSMMVPVSRLSLIYAYSKNRLLRVINFVTMPGLVGPIIGPLLGGWLVDVASWHWIFLVNLPIGVIGIILAQSAMPNFTGRKRHFDTWGLILFSAGLILLTLSFELGGDKIIDYNLVISLVAGAALMLSFYYFHARRVTEPLIDLGLFRIRTLRIGLIGNLFTRLGTGGMPFLLPLMLQVAFMHSPTVSGLMIMPAAVATIAAKWFVIPLVKTYGYKNILISNSLILALIISMFALPGRETPLYWLVPLLLVYGAANSIQLTCMNTLSLADLDNDTASGGNGLLTITQQLSMSFGVSVAALVFRNMENFTWLTHENIQLAFKYTFIILGIITFLSSGIFLYLKKQDGSVLSGHRKNNI